MEVELGRKRHFPEVVLSSTLKPNIIMWSPEEKITLFKLTVPREKLSQDCKYTVSGEELGQKVDVKDSQANLWDLMMGHQITGSDWWATWGRWRELLREVLESASWPPPPVRKGTRLEVTDGPEDLRFTPPHRDYSNKPSTWSRPLVPLHCLYSGIDCALWGFSKSRVSKTSKYSELAADAEEHGWKIKVCLVWVGCRCFVGRSISMSNGGHGKPRSSPAASHQLPFQCGRTVLSLALDKEALCGLQSSCRFQSRSGHTWDARCHRWALWRCRGSVIETLVKEGAALMTQHRLRSPASNQNNKIYNSSSQHLR